MVTHETVKKLSVSGVGSMVVVKITKVRYELVRIVGYLVERSMAWPRAMARSEQDAHVSKATEQAAWTTMVQSSLRGGPTHPEGCK